MARYYSFSVFAQGEIDLPAHNVILDRGQNAFTALVDNPDELTRFIEANGGKVLQVYPLDEFDPIEPEALDEGTGSPLLPWPDSPSR